MADLSPRQKDTFQFIVAYALDHQGNSPSIMEIARELEICYSSTRHHVTRLIAKEKVAWRDGRIVVLGAVWSPPDNLIPR